MTVARYRGLLCLYVALTTAATAASFFPDYSEPLARAYDEEPHTWLMNWVFADPWLSIGLLGGLFLVCLAGLVGLFFFKRWARMISLYSTLVVLPLAPFCGPQLFWGLESALFEASSIVWGAVLAVSYFSKVSERFDSGGLLKAA